jgi:hypothetical protein
MLQEAILLWVGLALFALVCAYIVQKRLMYFVPTALRPAALLRTATNFMPDRGLPEQVVDAKFDKARADDEVLKGKGAFEDEAHHGAAIGDFIYGGGDLGENGEPAPEDGRLRRHPPQGGPAAYGAAKDEL